MSRRTRAGLLTSLTGAAILLALFWARSAVHRRAPVAPRLSIHPDRIVADGSDTAILTIEAAGEGPPRITILENPHSAAIEEVVRQGGQWQARVRAGVLPGHITLRVEFAGLPAATAELTSTLYAADSFGDGTPDFLRLDGENERQTFRRWFTWLAEAQYFQDFAKRPAEINDCAALIRYAYREALHAHDSGWAESARVPVVPAFGSILKYQYPYTPLGAGLFRVSAGRFVASDLSGGGFAQFADAETLWRRNTHLVGRGLAAALAGDLLFFRHDEGRMPFHSMIYLGASQVRPDGNRYVLYHTGPDGTEPGEIRRLTLEELLRYPQPEWRPVEENPVFLGVFRWNILRKALEDDDARNQ